MKKLGFGLMRLPLTDPEDQKSIDMPQLCKMVDTFLERGYTYFDTAYFYHDRTSEDAIRRALVERHPRDSFCLATKLPLSMLREKADMERIFDEQRRKCGVEYFDYYLLHNMGKGNTPLAEELGCVDFIKKLRDEGKVRHIGFSFHDKADALDAILTRHPEVEFVQLQINYLDWDSERVQSRLCYETAVRHGKKVIIMEPVKGGVLAALPPEAEAILRGADPDASLASWAIRFAAGLPEVMMVLSGMSNLEQLLDNTAFMSELVPLKPEERELLYKVADIIVNYTAVPCTACRYCVEGCPRGIEIPEIFSLYNRHRRAELVRGRTDELTEEYNKLTENSGRASDCIRCRRCERACPQHIEIAENMSRAAGAFEN